MIILMMILIIIIIIILIIIIIIIIIMIINIIFIGEMSTQRNLSGPPQQGPSQTNAITQLYEAMLTHISKQRVLKGGP